MEFNDHSQIISELHSTVSFKYLFAFCSNHLWHYKPEVQLLSSFHILQLPGHGPNALQSCFRCETEVAGESEKCLAPQKF